MVIFLFNRHETALMERRPIINQINSDQNKSDVAIMYSWFFLKNILVWHRSVFMA
jgi:hypothetical protein